MSNQIVGRATITIPGYGPLATEKGATLERGGIMGEGKAADNGRIYRMDKVEPPKITCKVMATADVSASKLQFSGGTVLFETDTGQRWSIRNAFCMNSVPLDTSNGTYDLEICGDIPEEV